MELERFFSPSLAQLSHLTEEGLKAMEEKGFACVVAAQIWLIKAALVGSKLCASHGSRHHP